MERKDFLKQLKQYGIQEHIPNISEDNAIFLGNILRENRFHTILEIGTANGYSTIQFADILEKLRYDFHIDTIEFSQNAYEAAQKNFQLAQVDTYITQYLGDARQIIPQLEKEYDFVFIDGLKKASKHFLELVWEKVPLGGIIVIDDVIKFRHKMEDLYGYVEEKTINYTVIQIDPDDGIMLIQK